MPSLDPARAIRYQRGGDALTLPVSLEQRREEQHDPDALGPVRVLVTGAGGPAGVSVIRDLRNRGHFVLGVDADPMAVGLRLADESAVVPKFSDPTYIASLVRAATVANVQALICTVAEEYPALHAGQAFLEEAHVKLLLPSLESAVTCTDKWQFAECLRRRRALRSCHWPWHRRRRPRSLGDQTALRSRLAGRLLRLAPRRTCRTPSPPALSRSCRPRSRAASSPATS